MKSILLYKSHLDMLEYLTDEQAGKLFKAIRAYVCEDADKAETIIEDEPIVKVVYHQFKFGLDDAKRKYEDMRIQRINAINSRWSKDTNRKSRNTKNTSRNSRNTDEYEPIRTDTNNNNSNNNSNNNTEDTTSELEVAPADAGLPSGAGAPQGTVAISAQRIIDLWNGTCPGLPKLVSLSDKRKNKIRLRIEEMGGGEEGFEVLAEVCRKMQASKFLRGDSKRGWKATFDWLIDNSNNWVKVIEGQYDDRTPQGGVSHNNVNDIWER